MGRDASLDVHVDRFEGWQRAVLEALLCGGWKLGFQERIMFVPLGDPEGVEWDTMPVYQAESFWDILDEKVRAKETVGVVITWGGTESSGTVLLWSEGQVSTSQLPRHFTFMVGSSSRVLDLDRVSDVSWYLNRIFPSLIEVIGTSPSWEWSEIG